jgi:ABC-type dipeptide/oligopeptide/nickel transport system permease component
VKRFLLVRLALLVPTLLGVLTAIDKRDLPAVQGSILFLSMVFVIVNLVTDILYAKVDPRVAYD